MSGSQRARREGAREKGAEAIIEALLKIRRKVACSLFSVYTFSRLIHSDS